MDPREQIKSKVDLVSFIAEYIPLKQTGRNFKAPCPFHGEKTPSFVVSPERQIWHCFGCQKGGDCFSFMMEYEKMDFVEALKTLAQRTGVKLPDFQSDKESGQKERLLAINHLASEFYHYLLTSHAVGKEALEYIKGRGLHDKTIASFKIGYAPAQWDSLLNYLTKKKGYKSSEIEQAGLVVGSQKPGISSQQRYYDRFRGRIMFTLFDHRGNVVGFAGRVLDPDAKEAKYVNSPETSLYHKGELLYGLHLTKEAIKREDRAIIVEGELDMLSSFQAGVANVVALKGTAMTEMQVKLISRFSKNISLALDADFAGDTAARRGIEIADAQGLNIKVIQVKDAKDPAEAIQKNVGLWKDAIKHEVSVYDFLIDSAIARHKKGTPEGKKAISQEVLPSIARIQNEIVKAHFVKRLSRELEVSEEAIDRAMNKTDIYGRKTSMDASFVKQKKQSRQQILEEYFLALLLQKGDAALFKKLKLTVEPEFFQSASLRKIFEHLQAHYEKQVDAFSIANFVASLPAELVPTVDQLYLLDVESVTFENIAFEVERVIQEIRVLLLRKRMEQVMLLLREKEKEGEDDEGLAQELNSLTSELGALTHQKR
jgi:DNA primase